MAHHQSALQHFNNAQQSMHADMNPMYQPLQLPLQVPGSRYGPVPVQQHEQLSEPTSRLAIASAAEVEENSSEDNSEADSEVESSSEDEANDQNVTYRHQQQSQMHPLEACTKTQHEAQRQAMERQYAVDKQQLGMQRRAMEQRYLIDQQGIRRQGAIMNDRLRKLEEKNANNQAEQEAKDREMRRLQEENRSLSEQRYKDAEKYRLEMADLVRMHASDKQVGSTVFDSSVLQKVIREVQAQQLSKADVEKIIQERVASQLDGLARAKDVEAAGSRMSKALSQLPSSASAVEVQQAVRQELDKAINRIASKTYSGPSKIEGTLAQRSVLPTPPLLKLTSPTSIQRELAIPVAPQSPSTRQAVSEMQASDASPFGMSREPPEALVLARKGKKKEVSAAAQALTESPMTIRMNEYGTGSDILSRPTSVAVTRVKKDKKRSNFSSSDIVAIPVQAHARHVISQSIEHVSDEVMVPLSHAMIKAGKDSTNSRTIPKELPKTTGLTAAGRKAEPVLKTAGRERITHFIGDSGMLSSSAVDFPHNASQVTAWERAKKSESSRNAMISSSGAATADQALVKKSKHSKSSLAPILEGHNSEALVRGSKHDPSAGSPNIVSETIADLQTKISNMPLPKMTTTLELPDDFPDNASQISMWERKKSGNHQGVVLAGTSSKAEVQSSSAATTSSSTQELVRSKKAQKHGGK